MTDQPPEEPTELDDVVIIGVRPQPGTPKNNPPFEEQEEIDPYPNPEPGGGGGVWTEVEAAAEAERQKECAAQAYEAKLSQEEPGRKRSKEFFSLIWNLSGQTVTHAPRGGASVRITGVEIQETRNDFGISGQDFLGFAHNHPSDEYCPSTGALGFDEERTNAYPSENDWNTIDFFVPEAFRGNVTLFVLGCDDEMRAYPYADRANAERLRDQRSRPPEPINPLNCEQ